MFMEKKAYGESASHFTYRSEREEELGFRKVAVFRQKRLVVVCRIPKYAMMNNELNLGKFTLVCHKDVVDATHALLEMIIYRDILDYSYFFGIALQRASTNLTAQSTRLRG